MYPVDSRHATTMMWPQTNCVELDVLKLANSLEELRNHTSSLSIERIQHAKASLQEHINEELDKLKNQLEANKSSDNWLRANLFVSCIFAIFSFAFGTSLIASGAGTVAGSALIVSAFLTLSGGLMSQQHWDSIAEFLANKDEERKQFLSAAMPMAVLFLAAALDVGGLMGAAEVQGTQNIIAQLNKITLMAKGTVSVFQGWSDYEVKQAEAELKGVELDLFLDEKSLQNLHQSLETLMQEFANYYAQVKVIIEDTCQTMGNL